MGPCSGGRPTGMLALLVFGATLAVQLHARGLRSIHQGTSALSNLAEPSTNITTTNSNMLQPLLEVDAASLLTFPLSSGTQDPLVLASIPLLLAPQLCVIQREPAVPPSPPRGVGIMELAGRPKALTAARAAQLATQQALRGTRPATLSLADTTAVSAAYADILDQHNSYRARHQAKTLQWDEALAAGAAAYAAQCVFDLDVASTSGESLYAIADTTDTAKSLANAVQLWYNEVQLYDFNDPGYSASTGHFTQLVWQGSSSLGCAAQVCSSGIRKTPFSTGGMLVICRYWPPGNILGAAQFGRNVMPVHAPAPPQGSPPAPPPPSPPVATLPEGYNFVSPGCLESLGGLFWLCMQNDGNVVLFHDKQPMWASNTSNRSAFRPFKLTMQRDGNLVASDNLRQKVWMSSTAGQGAAPYRLVLQEDGNVVIFDAASIVIWATNSGTNTGTTTEPLQPGEAAP